MQLFLMLEFTVLCPAYAPSGVLEKINNIQGGTTLVDGESRRLPNALTINNGSPSLWDIASYNYVHTVQGNFRIIADEVGGHSVLAQSEIPAFLNRLDQGATIEGLSRAELQVAYTKGYGGVTGDDAIRLMLQDRSAMTLRLSGLRLYDFGC